MSREAAKSEFKFLGGRVGLDFANSLNWRLTAAPVELIPDYATFLHWSERRGTLSKNTLAALGGKAAADAAQAQDVVEAAHRLRAEFIMAADALWSGRRPEMGAINRALRQLPPQPQLIPDDGRFVFDLDGGDLRQPLWPVLWSFTAVLASSDAGRIGSCKADGCGWFFVDESPNHARLWCSDGCGNRERVRRSYAKRRSAP